MSWASFLWGVAAGVAGSWVYHHWFDSDDGQIALPDHKTSVLAGKIVPVPTSGSSAEGLLLPMAGVRSREGYEWGYIAGPGDTAGDIARAITGDDGRYQELIAANPQMKRVGEAGIYLGDKSWEFAPGELKEGIAMLLPIPWSRYIDQIGNPRGTVTPFPEDTRKVGTAGTAGAAPMLTAGRKPARLSPSDDGYAPYGRVIELEAA